ncbi:hypothetical protein AB1Y20_006738 [Prymnesium parvum]|uniref:Sfi1 spindle body domain-containing protein n=1 Tax=Prymnesium parvum TaxID=97485 RepID=A0AB34J0J3_PRYPA
MTLTPPPASQVDGGRLGDGGLATLQLLLRKLQLRLDLHRWAERAQLADQAQDLVAIAHTLWIPSSYHAALLSWRRHVQRLRCDKLRHALYHWTARAQLERDSQELVAMAYTLWIPSSCQAALLSWRRHVQRLRCDMLRVGLHHWTERMLQQQLLRWVSFVQGRRMHILALIAYSRFALGITRCAMHTWRSHALEAVQLDVLFLRGQYRLERNSLASVLLTWARSREWDEMYKYTPLQLGRAHRMKGGVREWYAFAAQTRRLASWMHRAQQHEHGAALREALKRWAIDEVLPERNAAEHRQKLTQRHLMRAAVIRWQERILILRLLPVADGTLRKRNIASRWKQWLTCVCLSRAAQAQHCFAVEAMDNLCLLVTSEEGSCNGICFPASFGAGSCNPVAGANLDLQASFCRGW